MQTMNLIAGSVRWLRPVFSRATGRLTSIRTSFNDPFFNTPIEAFKSLSLHFHSNLWWGNLWNSSRHAKSHFQPLRPAEPSPTRHFWRSFTALPVCYKICFLNASSAALASWNLGSSRFGAFPSPRYIIRHSREPRNTLKYGLGSTNSIYLLGSLYSFRWRPTWNDLAHPGYLFGGRDMTLRKQLLTWQFADPLPVLEEKPNW